MTGPVFVDSNVWVYTKNLENLWKARRAASWIESLDGEGRLRVSYQVVVEFYSVATRRSKHPVDIAGIRKNVWRLLSLTPIATDETLIDAAFAIEDRYRFSWWDSLIIAAAKKGGCRYLLTEDMQHRQNIDGLTIIDPFQSEPAEILA